MADTAASVLTRMGVSARIEDGEAGRFRLVFQRATLKADLPCRGPRPAGDAPGLLLQAALRELSFFDECDDVLEWSDALDLDPGAAGLVDEFRAVDRARTALIGLVGEANFEALKMEIAIGQAISHAAAGFAKSRDET